MRRIFGQLYRKKATIAALERLTSSLRMFEDKSAEAIEAFRRTEQSKLLAHCRTHVPYYRAALEDFGIRSPDDWAKIPITTKAIIRGEGERMLDQSKTYPGAIKNTSGGSTGEPVTLMQDQNYKRHRLAMKRVFDLWSGWEWGDPKVIVWGSERDIFLGGEGWRVWARRWLQNEAWVNAFRMDEASMAAAVQLINRKKPVQILAYAEAIDTLCQYIRRNGLEVHQPKVVMSTAGTLYPEMRASIESTLKAPVFNRYGSRELGDVACGQADGAALYVHPAIHYVEVLREDNTPCPAGEAGRIIVTCLTNRVMPLLRYEIGDVGAMCANPEKNRLPYQALETVKGRVTDTFLTEKGAKVHGEFFTHLLYHKPWVEKFRFHQRSDFAIDIYIKMANNHRLAQETTSCQEIESSIRVLMGTACDIRWHEVDVIAPNASGKFSYVQSDLSQYELPDSLS